MNSLSLLKYEIKRMICNKKYFYMISVLIFITLDELMRIVITGKYNTAPFSKWSYSQFIAMTAPIILIILIILCMSIFSQKEYSVRRIVFSTPISQMKYYMIKIGSTAVVFLITALVPIIMSFIYYGVLFGYYEYGAFVKPIILFLIPSFVLILGVSMVLGKINVKLLYVLIPIVVVTGSFITPLTKVLDLCGMNFLRMVGFTIAKTIKNGVVPYTIPREFIMSRIIFVIVGVGLCAFTCIKSNSKNK